MYYKKISCPYNKQEKRAGVSCYTHSRNCGNCGWNPTVARERLEKFCKKHGISIPAPKVPEESEEKELDS